MEFDDNQARRRLNFKRESNTNNVPYKIEEELNAIAKLRKERALATLKLGAIEQENIHLDGSVSKLKDEIRLTETLIGSDAREKTLLDIRANRLHVRQKLKQRCQQQQVEIKLLTARLEKLQMNTFPVFN